MSDTPHAQERKALAAMRAAQARTATFVARSIAELTEILIQTDSDLHRQAVDQLGRADYHQDHPFASFAFPSELFGTDEESYGLVMLSHVRDFMTRYAAAAEAAMEGRFLDEHSGANASLKIAFE